MHPHLLPLICLFFFAAGNCCFVQGLQHTSSHGYRRQMSQMRTMAQWAYQVKIQSSQKCFLKNNTCINVLQHGMRINDEASCSKPRSELVYLQDTGKIYLPRATLLHRCSDLTGCCPHATHSCQATQVETVHLYFFSINVQARYRQNQNIEKISFVNHTDCACMPLPVDNGRSESLRKNESAARVNTASSEQSLDETNNSAEGSTNSDDARSAMYNGDLFNGESGEEGNQIEINNGQNPVGSENVLTNWGKLLGMYKTKVYRDYEPSDTSNVLRRQSKFTENSSPTTAVKGMDMTATYGRVARPGLASPLSTTYHLMPTYQQPSQSFMYYYPPASSAYSVVNRLNSNLVKRAPLESNYHLAYRRVH